MGLGFLLVLWFATTLSAFVLDRTGLIFFLFAATISTWAVVDTPRFLQLLSLNRRRTFTRSELAVIRVPGTVVVLGSWFLIAVTLLRR
jgi:hypothetical protein